MSQRDHEIDDLVNTLRTKRDAGRGVGKLPQSQAPRRISMPGWAFGVVVAGTAIVAASLGGAFTAPRTEAPTVPDRVVVKETEAVQEVPSVCVEALKKISEVLDANEEIASAGDKQLDLASAAYIAILAKDWKGLNKVSEQQRALQREIASAERTALTGYADVKKKIGLCLAETQG